MTTLDDLTAARASIDHAIAGLTPAPGPAPPPPVPPVPSSGTRLIVWANAHFIFSLTDAKLDFFKAAGVGGFVAEEGYLPVMGGDQEWTTGPVPPTNARYALQRQVVTEKIVQRCAARGLKVWLGTRLANYKGYPLAPWFDDAAFDLILPKFTELAAAAKMLGFAGVAFDEELYHGGTWAWFVNTPGKPQSEVRVKVAQRGGQVARAITAAFPGVDIIDYGACALFPVSWSAKVALDINHVQNAYADMVNIDFWNGFTAAALTHVGAIRFWDSTFYKTWHTGSGWDEALPADRTMLRALFAARLSAWAQVKDRIFVSPFAWIDGDVKNEGPFTSPRPPAYVADQLAHFAKYAEGGTVGIYSYGNPAVFDYTPYASGMRAASKLPA